MIKPGKSLRAAGVKRALIVGPSCCQKKEGLAERAGKKIVKAVEKAGQKIEKAGEKIENEQIQMEALSMIAILGKKWAEVMAKDQAGYFGHKLPRVAESDAGDNFSGFSVPSDQGEWGRYEDEGASPFSLRSGEGGSSVAEVYPCPR
jgi:hypothetical protein